MTVIRFDDLGAAEGTDLGHSDWMLIDQSRIDLFADATDDHQWIHVDVARAARGPFRGPIAHGYLTLSATGARLGELLVVEGATSIINYGVDRVRFPASVPTGARIRTSGVVSKVDDVPNGYQVAVHLSSHADRVDKPVCIADVIVRVLGDAS